MVSRRSSLQYGSNAIGVAGFKSGPYTQNKGGYSGLPCGYTGYNSGVVSVKSGPNKPIRTHQKRIDRTAKGGQPVQRHKNAR